MKSSEPRIILRWKSVCGRVCVWSHLSWDQKESKGDAGWRVSGEGNSSMKKTQHVQKLWVPRALQELEKKLKASVVSFSCSREENSWVHAGVCGPWRSVWVILQAQWEVLELRERHDPIYTPTFCGREFAGVGQKYKQKHMQQSLVVVRAQNGSDLG